MLVGDECTEDWNYWIVLVSDEHIGDFEIRATVPWWGPYRAVGGTIQRVE